MRLSDRLHHGADAKGQGGGLRGRAASRSRRLALIAGTLGAFLAFSAVLVPVRPGLAHSLLLESSPGANSSLASSPREMVLRFNNRIEKKLSRIRLVGAGNQKLDLPVEVTGRADTLRASVPALSAGAWRLEWQVLSTDGHVVSGAFSFRLNPEPAGGPGAGAALPAGRSGAQPR
ncbi:MAG: copper resistance CopC family protein [Candidatus Rokuibacteriota bacterium]